MLRKLPVYIRIYLKSAVGYKYLILDTNYSDTLYVHEQEWRLFFEAKRGPRATKHLLNPSVSHAFL